MQNIKLTPEMMMCQKYDCEMSKWPNGRVSELICSLFYYMATILIKSITNFNRTGPLYEVFCCHKFSLSRRNNNHMLKSRWRSETSYFCSVNAYSVCSCVRSIHCFILLFSLNFFVRIHFLSKYTFICINIFSNKLIKDGFEL